MGVRRMTWGHAACTVGFAALLFTSHLNAAFGQSASATIIGQVTDESGGVLPGVTVTARSPSLQVLEVPVVTDSRGEYRLQRVRRGAGTGPRQRRRDAGQRRLDRRPGDELGRIYQFVPSIQLIDAVMYYHTDAQADETVPPTGLEAVTRAFAKIVDEANRLDLSALR